MNICCDTGSPCTASKMYMYWGLPYGVMNNVGSTKIVKFMIPGIEGFLLHRSNITHLVKISSRTQTMQTEYAVINKEGAAKFKSMSSGAAVLASGLGHRMIQNE